MQTAILLRADEGQRSRARVVKLASFKGLMLGALIAWRLIAAPDSFAQDSPAQGSANFQNVCGRFFSDSTFNDRDWSMVVLACGNGGVSSALQVNTNGWDGGPYRRIAISVNQGTGGGRDGTAVIGIHLYTNAIHDPNTGAIQALDYSEWAISFANLATNAGQAVGPALRQGTNFYILSAARQTNVVQSTWTPIGLTGLQATDFELATCEILPFGNHPNFCGGEPIQFGFFRANSAAGPAYASLGGIDSWWVQLQCYSICGQKFNDLNGDGVKQSGEPGLGGWTITLSIDTPAGSTVKATVQTDAKGNYCFTGLQCGAYTVSEVAMPGWKQTAPASPGVYNVRVGQGMIQRPFDFGNQVACLIDRSNKGTNFWLAFPANYAPDPANRPQLSLQLAGPANVSGQVTIPGLAFTTNWTIPASLIATVNLPWQADLGELNNAVTNKGIHVTATDEIAVYALNHVPFTSDAYLGLPSDVLGTEYIILGFPNVHTDVPELGGTQFAMVATEDNTTVTITPRVTTGVRLAGLPFTVAMNRGDTYQLRNTNNAPNDLSGTVITANQPIAVFGSHQCANIPGAAQFFGDHLVEQLLPTPAWGTNFVAMPLAARLKGDTYRIVAARTNTTVNLNGAIIATLNRGDVHERFVTNSAHITSDKPIMVAQYANSSDYDSVPNSDPFMVLIPATKLFREEYLVFSMTNGFTTHYLNVVAPGSLLNAGGIEIDGSPIPVSSFSPIPFAGPASGFYGAQINVLPGPHSLRPTALAGGNPFGVTVYGYATYDSYGYPAGLRFGDIQPPVITCPSSVTLPISPSNCVAIVPVIQATVFDNCTPDNSLKIIQEPPPGTRVGPGTYDVVLSSTDAAGNQGTGITRLIVLDSSPPAIHCPSNIVVRTRSLAGAVVNFTVTADTLCTSNLAVLSTPASGTLFPIGVTTVTCTTTSDTTFQPSQCSFTVTVVLLRIDVSVINQAVVLRWSANDILESAASVTGPWKEVPKVQSPYTISLGEPGLVGRQFYRLRCSDCP